VIYIWVRTTGQWENEQAFLAQLPENLKPKVQLWNATFNIPFHVFRHRVREIAQLNLSRVERAVCAGWDGIPEGALVLPVDDDDWISPDAGRVLEKECEAGTVGYYWIMSWVEVPINLGHRIQLIRRRILPRTPPKWFCAANNYAMVKSPEVKDLLASHVRASPWFENEVARRDAARVKRIDSRLTVANRTLASRSSLRDLRGHAGVVPVSRAELLRKFHRYRKLYDRPLHPDLGWCRPYVAMMGELMAELEPKDHA
jgi:hypothetical protein